MHKANGTKNKEVIAVDIDDALYDFSELSKNIITDIFINNENEQLKNYLFSFENHWRNPVDLLGEEIWSEVIKISHDPNNIIHNRPYNDCVATLQALADRYEIWYISNRSAESHKPTQTWLHSHLFPYSENLICCETTPKQRILDQLKTKYLIDDRPKTLIEFVTSPITDWEYERFAFGLLKEYNASLTDVRGIYLAPNWKLLARKFRKLELI